MNRSQQIQPVTVRPPHFERTAVLSRGSLHKNGVPKKRSKTFWDCKSIPREFNAYQKDVKTDSKTVIRDITHERNPFLMGAVSHDKYRQRGSSAGSATARLQNHWTIQRGNSKSRQDYVTDKGVRVKALPNIHNQGKNSHVVEDIIREQDFIKTKSDMLDGIAKMKDSGVLYSKHRVHIHDMGKGGRIPYTYNDYHSKLTNNGYARTAYGTFFVR